MRLACPLCADFVAEVGDDRCVAGWRELLELAARHPFPNKGWSDTTAAELCTSYAKHASVTGGGRMRSFASLRRFCAIAAGVNSNWAPHGPRAEDSVHHH
jgi:hypothetical protein